MAPVYRLFYYSQKKNGEAHFDEGIRENKVGRPVGMSRVRCGDFCIVWTNTRLSAGFAVDGESKFETWEGDETSYKTYSVVWIIPSVSLQDNSIVQTYFYHERFQLWKRAYEYQDETSDPMSKQAKTTRQLIYAHHPRTRTRQTALKSFFTQ